MDCPAIYSYNKKADHEKTDIHRKFVENPSHEYLKYYASLLVEDNKLPRP